MMVDEGASGSPDNTTLLKLRLVKETKFAVFVRKSKV